LYLWLNHLATAITIVIKIPEMNKQYEITYSSYKNLVNLRFYHPNFH